MPPGFLGRREALSRPFLTACWSNLVLVTYGVERERLGPHLPPGCRPDLRDGRAFVSLVAFDFRDTRVLGLRWPGFVRFPEINLRFYVTDGARRGVAFVRELVPRALVAWLARALYNEPYRPAPMRSTIEEDRDRVEVRHEACIGGRWHSLRARGRKPPFPPPEDSVEHFFKEHRWGFGRSRGGRRLTYEVRHPVWEVYGEPVAELDWDFGAVYGGEWSFLNGARPVSVVFAVGSDVSVSSGRVEP